VTAIGIFALWRMYGRHRYIISHFHDTVSSFYSYMGDYRFRVFVVCVISISELLALFAWATWRNRTSSESSFQDEDKIERTLATVIFAVKMTCALLTLLLVFPLKLGSQRCRCIFFDCSPLWSYRAHYIGGVAFLLINPLTSFVAYVAMAAKHGLDAPYAAALSIYGAALLFGMLSLSTKHPLCTKFIFCGRWDPDERTDKVISKEKAFPQQRRVRNPANDGLNCSKVERELKAIRDAEIVLDTVLRRQSQANGGDEEREEKIGQRAESTMKARVVKVSSDSQRRSEGESEIGGRDGNRDEMELPSMQTPSVAMPIEGELEIEATTEASNSSRSDDTSAGSSPSPDKTPLPKSDVILTEAKHPFLRLWSSGCEVAAITLIIFGNALTTCGITGKLGDA